MSDLPRVGFTAVGRYDRCESCGRLTPEDLVRIELPYGSGEPEGGFLFDVCVRCAEGLRRALGTIIGAHNSVKRGIA